MLGVLSHPLVVLLVGAVISGLLIPAINRRRQDHQKALEIKTQLVSEISEVVVQIIMATQFCHLRAASFDQAAFDQAYRDWEIGSAVIHTKLEAYFGDSQIPVEWCKFSEIVTSFYALEGIKDPNRKSKQESTIEEQLSLMLGPSHQRKEGWAELKNRILNVKSKLIVKVLQEKISVLQAT